MVSLCEQIFSMDIPEEELATWAERIDYPIRKIAHMTEYAVLVVLCVACGLGYMSWGKHVAGLSFVVSVVYAITDEVHQLYVPGRAGRVSDVFVDTVGVTAGLLMCVLLAKILRKHCEKGRLLLK